MPQSNDLSRSTVALCQGSTIIVVIEMSQSSWLVAGMLPGTERRPLTKLAPDEDELLRLLRRWRDEAARTGHEIERVVVAYEAGRDGFWLARSLLPATDGSDAFLTAGRNQIAAGYVSYGHTIDLGLSVGNGVILATFYPEQRRFLIVRDNVSLGMCTTDLAFNASVYRHLAPGMRAYVDDCFCRR
jgi:hypothetical protein